jgi:hypothetical protein
MQEIGRVDGDEIRCCEEEDEICGTQLLLRVFGARRLVPGV